jgi:hypothetical protein
VSLPSTNEGCENIGPEDACDRDYGPSNIDTTFLYADASVSLGTSWVNSRYQLLRPRSSTPDPRGWGAGESATSFPQSSGWTPIMRAE